MLGLGDVRARREYYLREVTDRVVAEQKEKLKKDPTLSLEIIINDALYQEQERLRQEKPSLETEEAKRFWSEIGSDFHRCDDQGRETLLRRIVAMYVEEIHGSFNPRLHGIVARIIPWFLKALLSRVSPTSLLTWAGDKLNLEDNLIISGPVEDIRALTQRGTLIMAPTHVSNLDSVVIGIGLYLLRLPPFTYGAGINLFTNPILSYFMNNLGAYKVDRRKKNEIYKATLKQYATLSMEQGEHNLFFPGGTRCRRGDIEQHLKLGLLGCGVPVYQHNLLAGKTAPDLFIVPVNLSYSLVLEAKPLIEEHLQESGKSRFIRVRNRYSRPTRILNFWRNLSRMHSKIHLRLGEPIDLFGNRVTCEGISIDKQGRPIDRVLYVKNKELIVADRQRDQEYTRELGHALCDSYMRNNVALATHVVAYSLFQCIRKRHPAYDLYRFLRTEGPGAGVKRKDLLIHIEKLLYEIKTLEKQRKISVDPDMRDWSAEKTFAAAKAIFSTFHDGKVIGEEKNLVFTGDMKLLYYYRNRLDHYGLEILT